MRTRSGIIISVIVSPVALLSGLAVFFAVRSKKQGGENTVEVCFTSSFPFIITAPLDLVFAVGRRICKEKALTIR